MSLVYLVIKKKKKMQDVMVMKEVEESNFLSKKEDFVFFHTFHI